jgi:DNA-binding transcriptional MocR family regulator
MPDSPVTVAVERLAAAIRSGALLPGAALPTHRKLAAQYGIAIASATKVYARLQAMGLVVGEVGRGTFVRHRPLQREWDERNAWDADDEARLSSHAVDLSFNHPSWEGQSDLLRSTLRELATAGDLSSLMHQQPPGGRLHERAIVADYLQRTRGVHTSARQVFFVGGAQQGLDVAVRAFLRPGDAVAVDALTYPGFKMVADVAGLTLEPVPSAGDGTDLAALDALCRRGAIRAIYVMPTLHNPLGWILSASQRERLVAIARRHDCLIVEDATYAYLVDDAPPPLVALAPERTVHVSSVSKSVASGLRFGYVVVPDERAAQIKRVVRASYWSLSSLVTAIATRWMANGTVARQEQWLREDARRRQAVARERLHGMAMVAHPSSLFLWLPLPEGLRMDQVVSALAADGIAASKAEAYATTRHAPHALRLGLSSMPLARVGPVLAQVRAIIERLPI